MDTISAALKKNPDPKARVLCGFDGYVDRLYRVLRSRDARGKLPFEGIAPFGRELASRAGKSGGFELDRVDLRLGGNAPLMARALAALGLEVDCVGCLGSPQPDPVFSELASLARLHSVAAPALTVALEFEDGKIMMGDIGPFESLDWPALKSRLGLEKMKSLAREAELIALVNWANMPHASGIWEGFLEEALADLSGKKFFFDIADLNRCGEAETRGVLALLKKFKKAGEVTLGINENEALQLAAKLGWEAKAGGLEALGSRLHAELGLDCLVLHPRSGALVFSASGMQKAEGRPVAKPVLSTGGGDNFNAGYCAGILAGLRPGEAARLACLVSSLYVELGKSPSRGELGALLDAN